VADCDRRPDEQGFFRLPERHLRTHLGDDFTGVLGILLFFLELQSPFYGRKAFLTFLMQASSAELGFPE